MTTKSLSQQRLERALKALELEQTIQRDWLDHGLDFVNLYVEDLEGNWLETWGENDAANLSFNYAHKWLKDNFSSNWLPLSSVFNENQLCWVNTLISGYFEPNSQRAIATKQFSLENKSFALVALLQLDNKDKFSLVFQLFSLENQGLIDNIKLSLLDEQGNLGQPSVSSKLGDNYLEIKLFKATVGTRFKVELSLNSERFIENFVL